jgi:cytochrome c oxidase assembly protein subunit 15
MNPSAAYIRYTWFVLIMVFMVILAGGVVRMTQSGMGCPDWPTCFGRWIPPTSVSQLPPDYEKYLRQQSIDHTFNVYHTWTEYVNRLLGALLGVFIFIHTIWSYKKFWKDKREIFFISLIMLLAVVFQGWLGKKVVDANLATVKVTTHMMVALLIAAMPVLIIARLTYVKVKANNALKNLVILSLLLVMVQVVLGTSVREKIDEIAASLSYQKRSLWIRSAGDEFLIHRSFSWIAAAACIFLCWQAYPARQFRGHCQAIVFCVALAFGAGLVMYFMQMPVLAQPLHLLFASLLAITLFSFRLQMK